MTRVKAKLSANTDNRKRKHQTDCDNNTNIVEYTNSTKNKKHKKEKDIAHIGDEDNADCSSKEKKVRFNIKGTELPSKSDVDDGQKLLNGKKKVRKPRWSEERKDEERKRRVEDGPTKHIEAYKPQKKKKTKKAKLKTINSDNTTSALSTSAIQYLQHWQHDRSSWKFSKGKQTWLLKHTFDLKKIPALLFPLLVEYISTCKGGARKKTYGAAVKIIQKLEDKVSTKGSEHEEEKEIMECLEGDSEEDKEEMHQRARSIMQQLSDCT